MVSAARRSTKVGGAHKLSAAAVAARRAHGSTYSTRFRAQDCYIETILGRLEFICSVM